MKTEDKKRAFELAARKEPSTTQPDDSLASIPAPTTIEVPERHTIQYKSNLRSIAVPRETLTRIMDLCSGVGKADLPIRELYFFLFGGGISLGVTWISYEPAHGHEWKVPVFGCACVCLILFGLVLILLERKVGALARRGFSETSAEIRALLQDSGEANRSSALGLAHGPTETRLPERDEDIDKPGPK
jgi:hypothetical protein